MQWFAKQISAEMNTYTIAEELLEAVFSIQSTLVLHTEGQWACVEVGLNTSTVALRVAGGDKKKNPVPRGITGPPCSSGI
jgi:hypothetical protein